MFVGQVICQLSDTIVDFAGKLPVHTVRSLLISHLGSSLCRMDHSVQCKFPKSNCGARPRDH